MQSDKDVSKNLALTRLLNRLTAYALVFALCLFFIIVMSGYSIFGRYLEKLAPMLFLAQIGVCVAMAVVSLMCLSRAGLRLKGFIGLIAAPILFLGSIFLAFLASGGAWGRPLRIRGRQLHPELREGSDWTRGERPDPGKLDEPTRQALEALWLHDAQKEHASVPAFSRIAWMLAAVGAPAELMEWSHRAALEEIEHTRLCFALAAGYAGRSYTVEAMPDLLLGGLDLQGDPMVTLAVESINDGCQLEDFNADVAAVSASSCIEPATRKVLEQIAYEERSHADFSWAVLAWTFQRAPEKIIPAIHTTLSKLNHIRRPTAVSWGKARLVAKANPAHLLQHGRLTDAEWGEIWDSRLLKTKERLGSMLGASMVADDKSS